MKRYVIKKYVMANSLEDALKTERKVRPDDGWLDEKQPEPEQGPEAIGYQLDGGNYYYSPVMKPKKRRKR